MYVLRDNQNLRPGADEAAKLRSAHTAAVGEHLDRPDAAAESGEVYELLIEALRRQLEQQHALLGVPIVRNEPVVALEAGEAIFVGMSAVGRACLRTILLCTGEERET